MDISKVLDDAKTALSIESDYALAAKLVIPKQRISEYRKGERVPDAYACMRLAEVLELDPLELLVQVEAATEKNEARRNYWRALSKRIGERVMMFFLAVTGSMLLFCDNSQAQITDCGVNSQKAVIFRSCGCARAIWLYSGFQPPLA